jgi:hypothetical protein
LRKRTHSIGINVKERTQEHRSVVASTLKIGAVNSPAAFSARYIGRKAAAVVSEEVNRASASSSALSTAACTAGFPAAI